MQGSDRAVRAHPGGLCSERRQIWHDLHYWHCKSPPSPNNTPGPQHTHAAHAHAHTHTHTLHPVGRRFNVHSIGKEGRRGGGEDGVSLSAEILATSGMFGSGDLDVVGLVLHQPVEHVEHAARLRAAVRGPGHRWRRRCWPGSSRWAVEQHEASRVPGGEDDNSLAYALPTRRSAGDIRRTYMHAAHGAGAPGGTVACEGSIASINRA